MEIAVFVLGGGLAVALVVVAVLAVQKGSTARQIAEARDLAESLRMEAEAARAAIANAVRRETEAVTRLSLAEQRIEALSAERDAALAVRDAARQAQNAAEREAALKAQQVENAQAQMRDWEDTKKQNMAAANEALVKSSREITSQLIEKAEENRKLQEENVRKTNEGLVKQMDDIVKAVAAFKGQPDMTADTVDVVMRALSNPGGAGRRAEIGLENTLIDFGLKSGRDYFVQYTVPGSRLRPDALVLLPGDMVWVIDSKSSKHFVDLARSEGTDGEEDAYAALGATMNQHLKELAKKEYRSEVVASYREAGRSGEIRRIMTFMFVPYDGAIEKIERADPEFIAKAAKNGIIVVGPSMLTALFGFARIEIDIGTQAENQQKIVHETQTLIDRILVVLDKVRKMGSGVRGAASAYNELVGSATGMLRPQIRKLENLGVRPNRHGGFPKLPPGVQLLKDSVIDGEAEEVDALDAITDETDVEDGGWD